MTTARAAEPKPVTTRQLVLEPGALAPTHQRGPTTISQPHVVLATTLLFSHVYYAHRWIFQYGDAATARDYTPTPLVWQGAKYPLLLGFAALGWLTLQRLRPERDGGFVFGLLLLAYSTFPALLRASGEGIGAAVATQKATFFFPVLALLAYGYRFSAARAWLNRILLGLVAYHSAWTAVQVAAFLLVGRATGLSYRNGFIRFGGGLDDPNGLGLFLVLPILMLFARRQSDGLNRNQTLALAAAMVMLALTISFSSYLGLVVGLVALASFSRRSGAMFRVVALALVVTAGLLATELGQFLVASKSQSLQSRFTFAPVALSESGTSVSDYWSSATAIDILAGIPGRYHSEAAPIVWFMDYGGLSALILVLTVALTIHRGVWQVRQLRRSGSRSDMLYMAALTSYCIAFSATSLAVPHFTVFPSNITFWLVGLIIWLPTGHSSRRPIRTTNLL